MMKIRIPWVFAILLVAGIASTQAGFCSYLRPFKHMVFPQVAAGGLSPNPNYQTWITLTNRGAAHYTGTMYFYTGKSAAWNPYVNGARIDAGQLNIDIPAGATAVYKVTVPGATEAGFARITPTDQTLADLTASIEGNLTYYVDSPSDSVGVSPAKPFYRSSLPFENFESICLSLVNTNADASADITLKLYSAVGELRGTQNITLADIEYTAQYLWQIFSSIDRSFGRGRLEIASTAPICGIALTQINGGQLSSLPLESTAHAYSVNSGSLIGTDEITVNVTDIGLWTEGSYYVDGYARIGIDDFYLAYPVHGYLYNNSFCFFAYDATHDVSLIFTLAAAFTPGQDSFNGKIYVYSQASRSILGYENYSAVLSP